MSFTLGTHNLHDEADNATPFADIILFTEAPKSKKGLARMRKRLPDHVVKVCGRQRSLMIAYRKVGPFKPRRVKAGRYIRVHGGRKKVTPGRGDYALTGALYGEETVLMVEHRINKPYDAAPGSFRRKKWNQHKRRSSKFIRRQHKKGRRVLCGGDTNTAGRDSGKYPSLAYKGDQIQERGRRLDRLGIDNAFGVGDAVYLSKAGSDHPRLRVSVRRK